MLWAFTMTEVPGEPIDLVEYDGHNGRSPMPFRINVTPRDGEVAVVLEREGGRVAAAVSTRVAPEVEV